jgi:hypothetical protein
VYRTRSKGQYGGRGTNVVGQGGGLEKRGVRADFFSRIVNMTTERGRGRILGPVDGMVSVLDIILKEGDMLNECTYPEQFT